MDDMLESYQFLVTQLENKSKSPDPPLNKENCSSEENFADDSSLSMVQLNRSSQSSASDLAHQPLGSSLPGVETPVHTIQQQFAQSCPKPPRSSREHFESHTNVSYTRNQSLLIQESRLFPLEYPPYPSNDVNFDEWTDYATYCGAEPEPGLLNLLSNEENASLSKKCFTHRSVDDVDGENSSSCVRKVTIRPRKHDFRMATTQPT